MELKYVTKRDETVVPYDREKIEKAVYRAVEAVTEFSSDHDVEYANKLGSEVAEAVESKLKDGSILTNVEAIQDAVESELMARDAKVAKAFILYREQRKRERDGGVMVDIHKLIQGYLGTEFEDVEQDWRKKENANQRFGYPGLINYTSGAINAIDALNYLYPKEIAEAHRNCDFHIHDLSAGRIGYCAGWSLKDLIEKGFVGGAGTAASKPAKHLDSMLSQLFNFLSTLQAEWAGAQAVNSFDTLLAPFVRVDNLTYKQVKQAMQLFLFSLNTGLRLGQCVPMTTKCLKADGTWVNGDELKIGDEIVVFNTRTCVFNTDIVTHVTNKMYNGKLHRYSSNESFQFSVTPDHRVIYYEDKQLKIKASDELTSGGPILIPVVGHVFRTHDTFCYDYLEFEECKIDTEDYNGKVWCPTTNTGTFVAKTEDDRIFITGNCPFTNISLDWTPHKDLKDEPVVIGGEYQDTTYGEYQEEMNMINKAFLELMIEGDKNGRVFTFPIPTYNITKDFNWDTGDDSNEALLFKVTGKYGIPYFQNFVNSDMDPSDIRAMCCRLRLNMKELEKKTGGLFGAGDKTGSIGVVTINMPRLGYLSKDENGNPDYDKFYKKLEHLMVLASQSLELKRKEVWKRYRQGLMPYTQQYLTTLDGHFSTIGLNGMNECCLNLFGKDITTPEGQKFAKEVLNFMREKLKTFQEETGHIYNLEASPAEGCSTRFARHDKAQFPDIITAGTSVPYYTNSTQLPVNFTDDLFEALDLQDELQCLYTGGTVFHCYLGESEADWRSVRALVKKIVETYRLPNFSITPTYSICPVHGYMSGIHKTCPHCK